MNSHTVLWAMLTRKQLGASFSLREHRQVAEELRAGRRGARGLAWEQLQSERGWLEERLGQELRLTEIHSLLVRRGVRVPYRTLHRFCVQELGFGRQRHTFRVVDGEPGSELQVDFGRMGLLFDLDSQHRRLCWGLIVTACDSRYMFCWLSSEQTLAAAIEGFEQAWAFFGGIFRVVIPDRMRTIVIDSDPVAPRFNAAFLEYAQARGFVVDLARGAAADRQATRGEVPQLLPGGWFPRGGFLRPG